MAMNVGSGIGNNYSEEVNTDSYANFGNCSKNRHNCRRMFHYQTDCLSGKKLLTFHGDGIICPSRGKHCPSKVIFHTREIV